MTLDYIFWTGIIGSLVLVTGAAWPIKKAKHPVYSTKNWLFFVGGFTMFAYAIMNFMAGGPIFFVLLQILVAVSSILMMLNTPDKIDIPIILVAGLALVIYSLYLFEGYNTVIFVLGLVGIAIGYVLEMGTVKRVLALTVGSVLIAVFSYIEMNWIFFGLNTFFAIFSGYYVIKGLYNLKLKKA